MADYKDILSGTLGKLADKAKEAAGASGVLDVYAQGTGRAKAFGQMAKLSLELNGEHEELKRIYTEIGRLYFEQMRENPESYFAPLFAQATALTESIHAREAEIAALKEDLDYAKAAQDIDVEIAEFEDIVNATEEDGRGQ
jgi:hypothetical protein